MSIIYYAKSPHNTHRDDLKNATDQMLVTASSLATILLKHFGVRSQQAHQLIDRCPLYVSKERALHRKIFRGSKKVRIILLGRCWCLVQLSRFVYLFMVWASHWMLVYVHLLCELLVTMIMHIYLFICVYQVCVLHNICILKFISSLFQQVYRDHHFIQQTYYSVTYCNHCGLIIWGIAPQGYQCNSKYH